MCIGIMCADMCIDMRMDMCMGMCIDACVDMCINMCIDMYMHGIGSSSRLILLISIYTNSASVLLIYSFNINTH